MINHTIKAQSTLSIISNSGNDYSFETSEIKKITFSEGEIIITEQNNTSSFYAINDVNRLGFNLNDKTLDLNNIYLENEIKTYPNPVNDILYVERNLVSNCKLQIKILNSKGQAVLEKTLFKTNHINLSSLIKGIYICQISTCNETKNIKLLKK